jgi:hypothetical protein
MSIRDKLAKIGFDVTEHQLKLYKALSGIEAVAEELGADPQGLSVQLGCKRQQAQILNSLQEAMDNEEKLELAKENAKSGTEGFQFFIPEFREVKGIDGKVRLVKGETKIEAMKLIE